MSTNQEAKTETTETTVTTTVIKIEAGDIDITNGEISVKKPSVIEGIEVIEDIDDNEGTEGTAVNEEVATPIAPIANEVKTDYNREPIESLKVSADGPDIEPEERKRRVKKLAGAISHSLRTRGEISVRAFGPDAIAKGAKALAIARDYLKTTHKELQLSYSPAFIQTKIGDNTLTGICFFAFVSENENAQPIDLEAVKSKLFVKSDPKDVDAETRRINVRKLAGAITHSINDNKECVVRCFGKGAISKAAKAIAIARGFVATKGPDLYCFSTFIVTNMNGNERTGISYYVFSNN